MANNRILNKLIICKRLYTKKDRDKYIYTIDYDYFKFNIMLNKYNNNNFLNYDKYILNYYNKINKSMPNYFYYYIQILKILGH